MEFLFFSASDEPLFVRVDAESANWSVDEMTLTAEFPFDAARELQRGQRVGFTDEMGVFQPFEIRKVENLEPDHYQRLTAEHIVISELSDEHVYNTEITSQTAQAALSGILSGTLWSVGTVTASGTSSVDIATGSVWQGVRAIEQNWNVYITPRVTLSSGGITGRYLDVAPATGVWRGVRLSINKNADEIGVTYDDTNVITAMYGYGKSSGSAPLTFAGATWSVAGGDPANKPSGQTYVVDTAATALYGRNGRPRWGYYQNGNVNDAATLLSLTWQSLQQTNQPRVSIDMLVCDLYRLGYADQPIRLHDLAIVDVEPIGASLQLEIVRLSINLLDPTKTHVTIGAYIPNIVYINRETAYQATSSVGGIGGGGGGSIGGGGGSGRGGGGGRGQTNREKQLSEFETEIIANNYEISLRAYQRDMTNVETILKQAGVAIDASGVIIYAGNNLDNMQSAIQVNAGNISLESTARTEADTVLSGRIDVNADSITSLVTKTGVNSLGQNETLYSQIQQTATSITTEVSNRTDADNALSSRITQNANSISLVVENGSIKPAAIVASINGAGSSVVISADHVDIDGWLQAHLATVDGLYSKNGITALKFITAGTYINAGTDVQINGTSLKDAVISFGTPTEASGQISIPYTQASGATGNINFNIAATQYYQNGVAAAWNNAAGSIVWPSAGTGSAIGITYPVSGGSTSTKAYLLTQGSWSSNKKYVYLRPDSAQGSAVARVEVDASSIYTAGYNASENEISVNGYYTNSAWSNNERTYYCYARAKSSGSYTQIYSITVNASSIYTSGYNAGYSDGQSSISYSSSDLHIGNSGGYVHLWLGNPAVISRNASIGITSITQYSDGSYLVKVLIDGDTTFSLSYR